jgi:hypothetical protein
MRKRCFDPSNKRFAHYGGRGIRVCKRWKTFEHFFVDMGPRPSPEHSLDRIDNDGHYSPDNCRWATRLEQANNKTATHWISHDGRTQSLASWARETGIGFSTIRYRLNSGWPASRALETARTCITAAHYLERAYNDDALGPYPALDQCPLARPSQGRAPLAAIPGVAQGSCVGSEAAETAALHRPRRDPDRHWPAGSAQTRPR